jgi:hypothetical protein
LEHGQGEKSDLVSYKNSYFWEHFPDILLLFEEGLNRTLKRLNYSKTKYGSKCPKIWNPANHALHID